MNFLPKLFCFALFFTVNLKASDFRYDWWTTAEGLPQNSINAVAQTPDGYLWIATFGGLARFDGVRFTIFNAVNAPALKSQRITALHADRAGILWVATETGEISCMQNGEFQSFDDNDEGEINTLYSDSRGYLWAGGANGARRFKLPEIQCSNGNHTFERLNPTSDAASPSKISNILETANGDIWLNNSATTLEKPSRLLRWRENSPIEVFNLADKLQNRKLPGVFVTDIALSGNDLWIAERSGLYLFDGQKFTKELEFIKQDATGIRFARDAAGNLMVNLLDGIARLNSQGHWDKSPTELSEKGGQNLFSDREGNFWLGTNKYGLCRVKQTFIESFDESAGVENNQTAAVLEDSKGNLWIAGFGLQRFENNRFVPEKAVPRAYLISLAETRGGTLLIGGYNTLFARQADGSVTDLSDQIRANLGNEPFAIKAIFEDSAGNLWFGFREKGVLRRDSVGNFKHFTTTDGLVGNQVQFIAETKDGAVWFAVLGGVSRFKDEKFTNLTKSDGFADSNIRDIRETPDGNLYFGTYGGGLSRLKEGKISTVTTQNGLFDDVVSRILIDKHDNFWMLGNQGIFTINKVNLDLFFDGLVPQIFCRAFGTADGMLTAEGNGGSQPAGWLAKDKRLWFPTIRGYVAITPPTTDKTLPNAVIEEVKLNGKTVETQDSFEIQPNDQNLEIIYTGLSFNRSKQLHFRYKLEGYDNDWTEVGTRRTAYYPYPPPGNYVFAVQVANADGVWNENSARLRLNVLPKFYRTWWFYTLCLLLVVVVVYLAFWVRISRLNRAKQAQESLSRRLIQVQEEERKRIAGDLHDSLSQNLVIIKNRAMISLREESNLENIHEQIEEIADAADESLAEVREIAANLRPYQIDRLGFANAVEALVRKANTHNLKVEARVEKIDGLLKPEMEINLYRILQESLNNIIKHSKATQASLEIKIENKMITVKILDNGKGFDLQNVLSAESGGNGFGLIGIRERARILGCSPLIETGSGKGTVIRMTIKY